MKSTIPRTLRMIMALLLVTLALVAIPVAGNEWNTISMAEAGDSDLNVSNDASLWNTISMAAVEDNDLDVRDGISRYWKFNTEAVIKNISTRYPGSCWGGPRILAAATGPGDVFYVVYYSIQKGALALARVDNGKTTAEKVVSSVYPCGISLDINPVTGTPAVSYRAGNSTPFFAYKQNDVWISEAVDANVWYGYSTSLAFDRTGTPHIAYDDGTSFSNLMYGTRNPNGTWTTEIADHGVGGHLGNAGKNPQIRVTDSGVYIAHGDGYMLESLRFTWKLAGKDWKSVTVDGGWGQTDPTAISGLTGAYPTFTMGPDGIATIIYEDAENQTLMMARGPLANDSFKTYVLTGADGKNMDGLYSVLVRKNSSGSNGGHLAFVSTKLALSYVDISEDTDIPLTREREIVDYDAATCTITSDSAGKPHIFYLNYKPGPIKTGHIKHAWRM